MLSRSTEANSKLRSEFDQFLAEADAMKAAGNRTATIALIEAVYFLLDKGEILGSSGDAVSQPSPLKSGEPIAASSLGRFSRRNYRSKLAPAS